MPTAGVIRIRPGVRLVHIADRVVLFDRDTFNWLGLPVTLAGAADFCQGRSPEWLEAHWPYRSLSMFDFLGRLENAGLIDSKEPTTKKPEEFRAPLVTLMLSGTCNMSCDYCYNNATLHGRSMPRSVVCTAVDWAYRNTGHGAIHFHFHGGEPLLIWDEFIHGVDYIRSSVQRHGRAARITVSTNGLPLSPSRVQTLIEKCIGVRLSFDGMQEINDRHRRMIGGRGTFARLQKILGFFEGYRDLCVVATVTGDQAFNLLAVTEFFQSRNATAVEFKPCLFLGSAKNDCGLKADPETFASAIYEVVDAIAAGSISTIRVEIVMRLLLPLLTRSFIHSATTNERCGAGTLSFLVDFDGTIHGCDMLPKTLPSLGTIHDEDVGDGRTIRNQVACHDGLCSRCHWFKACRGGCPGAAFGDEGALTQRHKTFCAVVRRVYPRLLEFVQQPDSRVLSYFQYHYKSLSSR